MAICGRSSDPAASCSPCLLNDPSHGAGEHRAAEMAQTFKVYDPATGQYVEKVIEGMTQPAEAVQQAAEAVQEAAQPVVQAVQEAAAPVVQAVQQAAAPVVQAVQEAAQPVVQAVQQAPEAVQQAVQQVAQPVVQAAQPVVQAAQPVVQAVQQAVPTIQVQPQLQQMPVLVQDPATGQMVQQMMTVQYDAATGTYVPVQQPQVVTDPKVLAEQQKAAEKAKREAEREARIACLTEKRKSGGFLQEELFLEDIEDENSIKKILELWDSYDLSGDYPGIGARLGQLAEKDYLLPFSAAKQLREELHDLFA